MLKQTTKWFNTVCIGNFNNITKSVQNSIIYVETQLPSSNLNIVECKSEVCPQSTSSAQESG